MTAEIVHDYNRKQIEQSHRQVFCTYDRFELAKEFCQQHPDICNPKQNRIRAY
jgi:hypothetical protein